MQETQVQSLGQEDPLEKEIVTHSSILAWGISCTRSPRATSHRVMQSWTRISDYTTTTAYETSEQIGGHVITRKHSSIGKEALFNKSNVVTPMLIFIVLY